MGPADCSGGARCHLGVIKLASQLEIGKTLSGGERAIVIRNLPFGVHGYDLEEELVAALAQGELPGVKKVANQSSFEHGFRIELTLTTEATIQALEQAVRALPSATAEIPIDLTVIRAGAIEQTTLPELIRHAAKQRLARHQENAKRAIKELAAIADLDTEPRRTSLS